MNEKYAKFEYAKEPQELTKKGLLADGVIRGKIIVTNMTVPRYPHNRSYCLFSLDRLGDGKYINPPCFGDYAVCTIDGLDIHAAVCENHMGTVFEHNTRLIFKHLFPDDSVECDYCSVQIVGKLTEFSNGKRMHEGCADWVIKSIKDGSWVKI